MEELATCTQFKYTNIAHNDTEDGKAGEVRTKLLEKTLSEDNKHKDIFAARKEALSYHTLIVGSGKSAVTKHISE